MDRNKARESLTSIADEATRQAETCRIEGNYHLETAVSHLLTARTGKYPAKEVVLRITEAVQTLLYDRGNSEEEVARAKYANEVLDAEFIKFKPVTYTPSAQPEVPYSALPPPEVPAQPASS